MQYAPYKNSKTCINPSILGSSSFLSEHIIEMGVFQELDNLINFMCSLPQNEKKDQESFDLNQLIYQIMFYILNLSHLWTPPCFAVTSIANLIIIFYH